MGNIGFGEFLLIVIVPLLIFGTSRLPALGDALGKTVKNYKREANAPDTINVTPKSAVIEVKAEKDEKGKG
ncbi:MAG: twin-arginine translocase TatA/TatE family subunit [Deltaproteobacteria bacterium]|nr:twin-arginine translocase TatA/TatE family subunit [Deltaproteobacteria bacterium]